jgi:ABC-type dipeptide/oligopeptide/nickel transport system permease component
MTRYDLKTDELVQNMFTKDELRNTYGNDDNPVTNSALNAELHRRLSLYGLDGPLILQALNYLKNICFFIPKTINNEFYLIYFGKSSTHLSS